MHLTRFDRLLSAAPVAAIVVVGATLVRAAAEQGSPRALLGSYRPTVSPFPPDQISRSLSGTALLTVALLLVLLAAIAVHARRVHRPASMTAPLASRPRWEWTLLLAFTAAVTALFLAPSYLRYANYGVQSFDIGIYSHAFWNALHGRGLFNSPEGMDHLSGHASPGLYLLLPLYALAPNVFTLLALNGLALTAGAIPAYLIARRVLGVAASLGCATVYLTNPALRSLNYDVHEITFAVPLLLWTIYFMQCGRSIATLGMLVSALLFKEDVGVFACFLGVYVIVFQRRVHLGAAMIVVGVIWLVTAINLIIPYHGGSHDTYTRYYAALGDTWIGVLLSPLLRPAALVGLIVSRATADYLVMVLSPFAFLPLLAPKELILPLAPLALNLFSSLTAMRSGLYHYEALLLPGFYLAFVVGLTRIAPLDARAQPGTARSWPAYLPGLVLMLLIAANLTLQRDNGRAFLADVEGDPARAQLDAIVALVPPDVPAVSPQHVQPYLSNRPVSAYLNNLDDFRDDRPPFHYAILPRSAAPPPPQYELVRAEAVYSLFRLRR